MNKKIIIIRQKYTAFGGAERFVSRVMQALMKQDVKVSVIARKWQGDTEFQVMRLNPFYVGRLWRDKSFSQAVCLQLKQEDNVLVQSHERLSCCDIYRAGDGVHREWLKQRFRINSKLANILTKLSPYHRYVKKAEADMFHGVRLKTVVCNSPMVRDELREYFNLPDSKVRIIRNGVNSDQFHPRLRKQYRESIFQRYHLADDTCLILILGSGFERKGVSVMLQALSRSDKKNHLMVVGKTSKIQRFEQQAKILGVDDRVTFAGPQTDPLPFYGAADVFALPALYDPAPNVILEAMACGLPIITSYKTGNWDLVEQHGAGFCCDALDDAAIVGFLQKLQQPKLRQTMRGNARKAILPWTEARMADDYQILYEDVLSSLNTLNVES